MLRRLRKLRNMNQRELAEALGYPNPQFVSNWERGVALPPLSRIPAIAQALGVDPKRLVNAVMQYREREVAIYRRRLLENFKQPMEDNSCTTPR